MFHMVGYDPDYDAKFNGQTPLGFEFDDIANKASVAALMEQIPRLIYAHDSGLSFGELFAKTCNSSPASASIYRQALGNLIDYKTIDVEGYDGSTRKSGNRIKDADRITPAKQSTLFV